MIIGIYISFHFFITESYQRECIENTSNSKFFMEKTNMNNYIWKCKLSLYENNDTTKCLTLRKCEEISCENIRNVLTDCCDEEKCKIIEKDISQKKILLKD